MRLASSIAVSACRIRASASTMSPGSQVATPTVRRAGRLPTVAVEESLAQRAGQRDEVDVGGCAGQDDDELVAAEPADVRVAVVQGGRR